MPFSRLGLRAELVRAIDAQGYTEPTPIQSRAIGVILEGRDVLAGAQTGTGKTGAFALPILQILSERPRQTKRVPRVLVLTPTRELAAQVRASFDAYGEELPLSSAVIFGGVNINPQKDALRRGVDIVVATPGRLLDHLGQGSVDLSAIEILVLDEADRMLDMGFIHDIRKVLAKLPKQRQNLLFSATYSRDIKQLADSLLHRPELIEIARKNVAADTVTQHAYHVGKDQKPDLLRHLIIEGEWYQALVFTRTKHGANRLAQKLSRHGIECAAIHGNKSQAARTRALTEFKDGRLRVLVATDIAARGLDIESLPHVVNYELPNVPEDYVHRIGRTGRAGEEGAAVSLVGPDESKLLVDIQRFLKKDIPTLPLPEFARSPRSESAADTRGNTANDSQPRRPRNGNRGNQRPSGNRSAQDDSRQAPRRRRRPGPKRADATR
ncbi:MAG: DEAD/DEAH box helicase [Gammaproteobacteria bacterium]|nr:DEAD/DEAH box helicase [Gammaproteobacteria bacterium]